MKNFPTSRLPAVIFSGGAEIVSLAIAEALVPAGVPLVVISLGQPSILRDVQPKLPYLELSWPPESVETAVAQVIPFLQKAGAGQPIPWPAFASEDGSLRFLIEAYDVLRPYLAIPPGVPHLPMRGLDKAELFQTLAAADLQEIIAPTIILHSPEDATKAADYFDYQLIFKPAIKPLSMQMGSLKAKALAINNKKEVTAVLNQLEQSWSVANTWLAQRKLTPSPMGEGLWWGIRTKSGKLIGLTAYERWKHPQFGGSACWVQTASIPELHQHAARILHALDYQGITELPFLQDENGRWRLLELNPRPWLQAALPTQAGIPLLHLLYTMLCDEQIPSPVFTSANSVSWVNVERMLLAAFSGDYGNRLRTTIQAAKIIRQSSYKAVYDSPLTGVQSRWLKRLFRKITRTG